MLSCGADRSTTRRNFLEYLRSANPIGLILKVGKGGVSNGPTIKPLLSSWSSNFETTSGLLMADREFKQVKLVVGRLEKPVSKPYCRLDIR